MAEYPRHLNLSEEREEALKKYLDSELLNHYMERGAFVDELVAYQEDYWAKPSEQEASFPFKGAANIVIPLSAIAVEAVHSRVMTTLFALKQFTTVQAVNPDWTDAAPKVEKALDHHLLKHAQIRKKIEPSILEIEKLGTGVGKSGYEKIVRHAVREMEDGREDVFSVVTREGVTIDSVPLSRFLMPFYATDPQESPWVGEEHESSEYQIRQFVNSGFFLEDAYEKIESYLHRTQLEQKGLEYSANQENLENMSPIWPPTIIWEEIWLGFDVDNSGVDSEIVVYYHRDSREILGIRYNWHDDLHRPYRIGTYMPVEHRWRGIGICKQNQAFQDEITTQHRQRLDNATLANVRMIKIQRQAGYGPNEPIYPGKIWFLDEMTDVDTFQLGEVYQSSFVNEQATLIYSQQRTGVNEVTLGMPQAGTPGTATSDLARIQEGNKKFDYYYANIKDYVSQLTMDAACNLQQFGPPNLAYYESAAGGQRVQQFFSLPQDLIRDSIILEIGLAGQNENNLLDRQNWQQIFAMIQQYYNAMIQIAQLTGDQQMLLEVASKARAAGTEAMRQLLESFDVRNIDRLTLEEITNGPQGIGGIGGGTGGIAGILPPQGLQDGTPISPPFGI